MWLKSLGKLFQLLYTVDRLELGLGSVFTAFYMRPVRHKLEAVLYRILALIYLCTKDLYAQIYGVRGRKQVFISWGVDTYGGKCLCSTWMWVYIKPLRKLRHFILKDFYFYCVVVLHLCSCFLNKNSFLASGVDFVLTTDKRTEKDFYGWGCRHLTVLLKNIFIIVLWILDNVRDKIRLWV